MTPTSPHPQESPQAAPRRVASDADAKGIVYVQAEDSSHLDDQQQAALARHMAATLESNSADQLRSIVQRIERLEGEKSGLASDIKDIYAEAKGNGFDTKTIRKVIALRKQDVGERDEAQHLLDTYCRALGMTAQMDMFEGDEA